MTRRWRAALCPSLIAVVATLAGCGDEGQLGPPDSYTLLTPAKAATSPGGLPAFDKLAVSDPAAQPLAGLLADGFASEMVRTAFLVKQLVREGQGGAPPVPAVAGAALPIVMGADRAPYGRGLALARWLRAPVEHPDVPWIGLPAASELERDKALVQTVTGRLATYVLQLALTGGTFSAAPPVLPPTLGDGYRIAMEVIAREWRTGKGPQGVVSYEAGTADQRRLFADVRENRSVLAADGHTLRPAPEMLADPGVAATVLYRMAQSKAIAGRVAKPEFYAPFAAGRLPPGVSPAAVLGAFRNFQAKLLASWAGAVKAGHAPRDIADLVDVYAAAFPDERREVLRIFVVTTFAATVEPGGVSTRPQDASRALATIDTLVAEALAGRRSLHAATAK